MSESYLKERNKRIQALCKMPIEQALEAFKQEKMYPGDFYLEYARKNSRLKPADMDKLLCASETHLATQLMLCIHALHAAGGIKEDFHHDWLKKALSILEQGEIRTNEQYAIFFAPGKKYPLMINGKADDEKIFYQQLTFLFTLSPKGVQESFQRMVMKNDNPQNRKTARKILINISANEIDRLKSLIFVAENSISYKKRQEMDIELIYNSNRIEGNLLSLHETERLLIKGLTAGGKRLTDHLEAKDHYEALNYVYEQALNNEKLSEVLILQLHYLLLQSTNREEAGKYRKTEVNISGSRHHPPSSHKIPELMRQLLNWWQENDTRRLHTLIQAAELHERLVSLHPFADGNGRTARLLMNLVLLQGGYAAANIAGDRDNRLTYYAALEKCNLENDKDDFISFIINCEKRSIQKILQTAGEFPLKDSMPPFIPTESMPDTAFFDGMEFVFIEEGEFLVNPYDEDDQQTVNEGHRVKIRPGFWIGKKPVSREQWEKIMGTDWNPHENFPGKNNEGPINNEEPIINVDWNIIQKFIEKLNEKNCGQDADSKTVWQNKLHNCYRLPTETEWKFALQNEQICTELQETVQKKSCDCWLEWTMDAYSDCRYITKHDPALNPINDSWTPDGELVLTGIQTGTPTPYKRTFAREKCSSDSIGFRLVRTVSED